MIIKVTNIKSRRNFLTFSAVASTSLFLKPNKLQANPWVVGLVIFVGRILIRSAVRKIGQTLVRQSVSRGFASRAFATSIITATTIDELSANVADLTEIQIKSLAKQLKYKDDNYSAVWIKGEDKIANKLEIEFHNYENKDINKPIEIAILNENNTLELSGMTDVFLPKKSTSTFELDINLVDFDKVGVKKLVLIDNKREKSANGILNKVIIEDFNTVQNFI